MPTDEPDEQLDPVSPADDARIRELLSGARATGAMPTDVAARLDDVVAGLAAERVPVDPVPADNVVPITRTRRHRVVAVLGAAAAVAVFGLGIGAVLEGESEDMGDAGSAGTVERGANDGDLADEGEAGANDSLSATEEDNGDVRPETERLDDRAYAVRSRHLSRDLARIQSLVLPEPAAADYERSLLHAPKGFACELPVGGSGVLVGVRYDGRPAFVRFLDPMGDSQVVEVLQCRTGDLLRSTTLPTRG